MGKPKSIIQFFKIQKLNPMTGNKTFRLGKDERKSIAEAKGILADDQAFDGFLCRGKIFFPPFDPLDCPFPLPIPRAFIFPEADWLIFVESAVDWLPGL